MPEAFIPAPATMMIVGETFCGYCFIALGYNKLQGLLRVTVRKCRWQYIFKVEEADGV
jgi:hypothetical protein